MNGAEKDARGSIRIKTFWRYGPKMDLWNDRSVDGIGNGYGSPVFAGERFYITGEIDSMAVLHCFDLDGKLIWQAGIGS